MRIGTFGRVYSVWSLECRYNNKIRAKKNYSNSNLCQESQLALPSNNIYFFFYLVCTYATLL